MFLLRNILLLTSLMLFSSDCIYAQIADKLEEQTSTKVDPFTIKAGFQFWNVYSMDHQIYDEKLDEYSEGYNSWNSLIRRARVNTKFQPSDQILIQGNLSADQLGKDDNSALHGGKANSSNSVSILDLYARYNIIKGSDLAVFTIGLQRPMIGRETVVSSLQTSSLEKSISQYYQRKQIVGSGNGRTVGVNIGGQSSLLNHTFTINYNAGIFTTPTFYQDNNHYTSPLFAGRLSVDFGDPESASYSTSSKTNYLGKRNGLTLSTSFSYQDQTSVFDKSTSLAFDVLFNRGYLNLDGEFFFLNRSSNVEHRTISAISRGGYLRAGYSISTYKSQYLEPVIMYTFFNGGTSVDESIRSSQLNAFSGIDNVLEVGLNYIVSSHTKLSLFYTNNSGDSNKDHRVNNFNNYDSLGRSIHRGDKLTLAVTLNI